MRSPSVSWPPFQLILESTESSKVAIRYHRLVSHPQLTTGDCVNFCISRYESLSGTKRVHFSNNSILQLCEQTDSYRAFTEVFCLEEEALGPSGPTYEYLNELERAHAASNEEVHEISFPFLECNSNINVH